MFAILKKKSVCCDFTKKSNNLNKKAALKNIEKKGKKGKKKSFSALN